VEDRLRFSWLQEGVVVVMQVRIFQEGVEELEKFIMRLIYL
jgi:hypothetical protein